MNYTEEEKAYVDKLFKMFDEMEQVPFRDVKITKERFVELSNLDCRTDDEEELRDFAFISTHQTIRDYYLSPFGGLLAGEKLENINKTLNRNLSDLKDGLSQMNNLMSILIHVQEIRNKELSFFKWILIVLSFSALL